MTATWESVHIEEQSPDEQQFARAAPGCRRSRRTGAQPQKTSWACSSLLAAEKETV